MAFELSSPSPALLNYRTGMITKENQSVMPENFSPQSDIFGAW